MNRYATLALLALLAFLAGTAAPSSGFGPLTRGAYAAAERPRRVVDSILIRNAGSAAMRDYPFQFGRPFVKGAIAHAPQVLLDRRPIPTQADVKNRYPDGSVEFAVLAVVIPEMRAGATRVLTFQDATANSNTPLSAAQMLAPGFNFDARMRLAFPARITGPALTGKLATFRAITNGGFTIAVNGMPYQVTGLNFSTATTVIGEPSGVSVTSILQAALAAADVPAYVTGALAPSGSATMMELLTKATGPLASLGYASAPASGTDISALLGWTAATKLNANLAGSVGTASARAMLAAGNCRNWTAGPIAQTIVCADDSAARAYDIGNGDGFRPFRPRFYATFWPSTNQVFVRAVGENGLTSELEDLALRLTISGGSRAPAIEYSADLTGDQTKYPKVDWALSRWSRTFWLGGTPPAQVDIDNNLAYLESTRFIPNYDTSVNPAPNFASFYVADYTGVNHDLYDGAEDNGIWQTAFQTQGARQDIGPYPQWDVMWLYGGDWRMRQVALNLDDIGAAAPLNLREDMPAHRLSRADPAGSSTGLGHTVSITDRKSLITYTEADALTYGSAADNPIVVGPVDLNQPWSSGNGSSHQPDPWFVPYVLTGDRWYLSEMNAWAGFSAAAYVRVPTGDYGSIGDELRGAGWAIRTRSETAFIEPDGAPEKAYFTYLVNDALAGWEGEFGIAGTPYDGSPAKLAGAARGDVWSHNGGPDNGKPPPLGNWEANGDPVAGGALSNPGMLVPGVVGSMTSPWMQWYVLYSLGRAKELGFAAEGVIAHSAPFLTGIVDNSGEPALLAVYWLPIEAEGDGFLTTWPAIIADIDPTYLAKIAATAAPFPDGYFAYSVAAASMLTGEPGGMQAWSWIRANLYPKIPWATQPKWNILPRTDTNALPPQPTAMPPG